MTKIATHIRHTRWSKLAVASLAFAGAAALSPFAGAAAAPRTAAARPAIANLNPADLPICPAPGWQIREASAPKPLTDPNVGHCAVAPASGGLHLKGINEQTYLVVDGETAQRIRADNLPATAWTASAVPARQASSRSAAVARSNCTGGEPDGGYDCQNGQAMIGHSGIADVDGVRAALYAESGTLSGWTVMYNWVGMQYVPGSNANLEQIGIAYNNLAADGGSGITLCDGHNDVSDVPMILTQDWNNSTGPTTSLCFPAYIFGLGSYTTFQTSYSTSSKLWTNWVNWNSKWEAIDSYSVPAMTPANAIADLVPAEIIHFKTGTLPTFKSIPDKSADIFNGSTLKAWSSSVDTYVFEESSGDGATGQSICDSNPVQYTENTAAHC